MDSILSHLTDEIDAIAHVKILALFSDDGQLINKKTVSPLAQPTHCRVFRKKMSRPRLLVPYSDLGQLSTHVLGFL